MTADNYSRRLVKDSYCRVGLVDVLTARTARTVGSNLNVLVSYLYLIYVLKLGHNLDRRERGLTATCCIEGGNSDESVHSVLTLKIAVSIESLYHNGSTLDTCRISVEPVDKLIFKPMSFCPTGYHSIKHLCPVLSLSSACSGVEGYYCVILVILT